jgi:hypothetical protein
MASPEIEVRSAVGDFLELDGGGGSNAIGRKRQFEGPQLQLMNDSEGKGIQSHFPFPDHCSPLLSLLSKAFLSVLLIS